MNNADGFWSHKSGDFSPWIQVSFLSVVTITEIQTQGATNADHWVEELQVQTGYSEDTLSYIMDGNQTVVSLHYRNRSLMTTFVY